MHQAPSLKNWRKFRRSTKQEKVTTGASNIMLNITNGKLVYSFRGNQFFFKQNYIKRVPELGINRLCSATFEQLLAFGATFCGFSNLEQVLPFRAIFEQNIGLEHISSTKKSTISWKTSIHANFLNGFRL